MKIKLARLRLTFPDLHKPSEKYGRYGASFPIVPGSPQQKALRKFIDEIAEAKWPGKGKTVLAKIMADGDNSYLEKPKTDKDGEVYDGYQGMYQLNCSSTVAPSLYGLDGKTRLTPQSGLPYSGCYVNVAVDIWAQDNGHGRRINAQLTGVQFAGHGEAFGGAAPSGEDEFDDITDIGDIGDDIPASTDGAVDDLL